MSNINESQLNPADVKAIFKTASDSRENQGLLRKMTRLKKPAIDKSDLQKAWSEDGYPDDIRDIERILRDHGFGDKEIQKIFVQVLGGDKDGYDIPVASPAVQKIADAIKESGIEKEIIQFLEREYSLKESYSKKVVVENIRSIFEKIVSEERTERLALIKAHDKLSLGRTKK